MSEIRFYHLFTQSLEQALPAILNKALSTGRKIVVRLPDKKAVEHFDDHLWTYHPDGFLPHGAAGEGYEERQPVLLTDKAENPSGADMIVLGDIQTVPENINDFSLCCDFLNGQNEDSVAAARIRWKAYKDAGHSVNYWQQTENGGWEQKA